MNVAYRPRSRHIERVLFPRSALTALLSVIVVSSLSAAATQEEYAAYLDSLYRGSVPLIEPEEAEAQLSTSPDAVLLDVRSPEERSISFIPGSMFVAYEEFSLNDFSSQPRDIPIVIYCAVGYRSERVGEQLMEAGFTEVTNLYGGIIEWYNRGLPVALEAPAVSQDQTTDDAGVGRPPIHGYRPRWGKYVADGNVTYDPRPR